MKRLVTLAIFVTLLLPRLGLADQPAQAHASRVEATRVVCLELIDTDAVHAGELGIVRDGDNLRDTLEASFRNDSREDWLRRIRFEGRELTPERVLATLMQLTRQDVLRPSDTLLVYYTGHGVWTRGGHVLTMAHGSLYRADLLQAMNQTGARLRVLLTDCCSSNGRGGGRGLPRNGNESAPNPPPAGDPHGRGDGRTVRDLLLRCEGTVDITAAQPGTPAFGDPQAGGRFTALLLNLMRAPVDDVDSNGDGRVDWDELIPCLQRDTHGQAAYVFSGEEPAPFVTGPLPFTTGPLP